MSLLSGLLLPQQLSSAGRLTTVRPQQYCQQRYSVRVNVVHSYGCGNTGWGRDGCHDVGDEGDGVFSNLIEESRCECVCARGCVCARAYLSACVRARI